MVGPGHTPQTLSGAFRMHESFIKTGDMHGADWFDPVKS
jgi:acetyl-CoA hydrolase